MARLIVLSFITLDGVVEDPSGSDGTPFGGWAMQHGPQAIAGDKFRLGPILRNGTLLFGGRTWDLFKTMWPYRDDPFSEAMNAATKAVVTHRPVDDTEWAGSRQIDGRRPNGSPARSPPATSWSSVACLSSTRWPRAV